MSATEDVSGKPYQPPPGGYEKVPLAYDEIKVAAAQMISLPVDPADPRPGIQNNLDNTLRLCDQAIAEGCQLIVFPEFTLTKGEPGFSSRWTREEWLKVAIMVPGPETQAIAQKAKKGDCHICFSSIFQLPDWPVYQQHPSAFPPNLLTRYQKEHDGRLPPDHAATTRQWYLKNARWQLR